MNMHARLKAKINAALSDQWGRPTTDMVQIDLPLPISTNELWRPANGELIKTDRYKSWIRSAGNELNRQRPGRIDGAYSLSIIVNRRRSKIDLGNAEKAISDLLQTNKVIENDRRAERIILQWSDAIPGCRVFVERWRREVAA